MGKLNDYFVLIRNGASIKQDKISGGYPITRIETIADGTINRGKMGYAGISDISKYNDFILEDGDILMSHINSEIHLGKTALYNKINDENIIHGMNLLLLKPNRSKIYSGYANYYFKSHIFKNQIPNIVKKSVNQASFTVTSLKELEFNAPSLHEQKKVIFILDKASNLIELRKKQIEELDNLIQSVFYDMFGDPNSNPMNWNSIKLFEVIKTTQNGLSRRKNTNENYGDIVLRLRDVGRNEIDFSDINRFILDDNEKSKYRLNHNDLLFVRVNGNPGYVGRCSVFEGYKEPVCYNDHIIRTVIDTDFFMPKYLVYFLNTEYGQAEIRKQIKTSAGQYTISRPGMNQIELFTPPISLQKEFISILNKVEKQKKILHLSLTQLELNYKSLMQRAFNGTLFE